MADISISENSSCVVVPTHSFPDDMSSKFSSGPPFYAPPYHVANIIGVREEGRMPSKIAAPPTLHM